MHTMLSRMIEQREEVTPSTEFDVWGKLGPLFIGTLLGAVFLGITFLQTAFYYKTYRKDTVFLKSLVGVLSVLDTLSLVLWIHAAYWFLIPNFGNVLVAETIVIWSEAAEPPITGVVALIVHLFLIWRIQILNAKWRGFCIVLVIGSFVTLLATIAATVVVTIGIEKRSSANSVISALKWCGLVADIVSVGVDIGIAGSIAYLLHRGRTGVNETNRLLSALTLYIVSSGLITTVFRVVELVLAFEYPTELLVLIPYIPTSKAYTNALLATLNSRADRRVQFSSGLRTDIEWRPEETVESLEYIGMSGQRRSASDCSTKVDAKPSHGSHFSVDVA